MRIIQTKNKQEFRELEAIIQANPSMKIIAANKTVEKSDSVELF